MPVRHRGKFFFPDREQEASRSAKCQQHDIGAKKKGGGGGRGGKGEKGGLGTNLLNQVPSLRADEGRYGHVSPCDSPLCHGRSVLEWSLAHKELVGQDAQAPEVDLVAIPVFVVAGPDHLGRKIVQRAALGLAPVVGGVHAPAKVGDLDLAVHADEYIFRLDVPVDYMLAVEILECAGHLGNVLGRLPLGEPVLAPEVLVELALARILEDQKNTAAVVEVTEELKDVWVAEVALDLNLAADLLFNPSSLPQLFLQENFERANEAALPLARQIHAAKLALAQRTANLKHAEVVLRCWRHRLGNEAHGRSLAGGGRYGTTRQRRSSVGVLQCSCRHRLPLRRNSHFRYVCCLSLKSNFEKIRPAKIVRKLP